MKGIILGAGSLAAVIAGFVFFVGGVASIVKVDSEGIGPGLFSIFILSPLCGALCVSFLENLKRIDESNPQSKPKDQSPFRPKPAPVEESDERDPY